MFVHWDTGETKCRVNLANGTDISLVLKPNEPNVNCYYASEPKSEIIRMGSFVGSVAEGGPVNYAKLCLTPHGNGTHTECYGHISKNKEATIANCLTKSHFTGLLISLSHTLSENGDSVITAEELKSVFEKNIIPNLAPEALIIRTLPNLESKTQQRYSGTNPPYLDGDCGKWLSDLGISQLIIDLPSVDREEDGGQLAAHKAFWQYPENIRTEACITELVFVPNSVTDGYYWVNLQTINIASDASPSRVVLFPLELI